MMKKVFMAFLICALHVTAASAAEKFKASFIDGTRLEIEAEGKNSAALAARVFERSYLKLIEDRPANAVPVPVPVAVPPRYYYYNLYPYPCYRYPR